jgi:hypothetical protein
MSYSYRSIIDGGADSDMIYYNATITATAQRKGVVNNTIPPIVSFNETRDAPIIKDASQYYFSIIRFAMNGVGKNLPLFIPVIQTNGTGVVPQQADPNLTIYNLAIPYERAWAITNNLGVNETRTFTIYPVSNPVLYRPETQNPLFAPVPVSGPTGFARQDLSSRYYWVYTYQHFVDLVNETFLSALNRTYDSFQFIWTTDPTIATPFPYPTFASFLADHDVPTLLYNEDTEKFEIHGDTRAFNIYSQITGGVDELGNPIGVREPLPAFVAPVIPAPPILAAVPQSSPYLRLFMNADLFALLSNFDNTFYGATNGDRIASPLAFAGSVVIPNGIGLLAFPADYTNEILFTNDNYTNIINHNPLLQNFNGVPPPAYNEYFLLPTTKQNLYWKVVQDWSSTDSLWSPCAGFVFTSTLLPIKKEYTAKPIQLGDSNVGGQSTNSPSDFAPIIADIVIDQAVEKAQGYKTFTLYEPTAEYKMASLTASHDEIRNIDIQVYWKYRLTGELIPLSMTNAADVSIKVMFRKVDYTS